MPMTFQIPESAFAPFYDTPVAFHGERAAARPVDLTVDVMITEDVPELASDAIAPTAARVFDILSPASSWRDDTPPQIGEWVRYEIPGETLWLKVDTVKRMPDGDFSLTATWKPGRKPSW